MNWKKEKKRIFPEIPLGGIAEMERAEYLRQQSLRWEQRRLETASKGFEPGDLVTLFGSSRVYEVSKIKENDGCIIVHGRRGSFLPKYVHLVRKKTKAAS